VIRVAVTATGASVRLAAVALNTPWLSTSRRHASSTHDDREVHEDHEKRREQAIEIVVIVAVVVMGVTVFKRQHNCSLD